MRLVITVSVSETVASVIQSPLALSNTCMVAMTFEVNDITPDPDNILTSRFTSPFELSVECSCARLVLDSNDGFGA